MKRILFSGICFLCLSMNLLAQKTWTGAGAGGTGTDFNTAGNWSPSGVPTSADNVTIAITSDATINLSGNASINNLTFTVSGNNNNARLYVGGNTLIVNGTATIDILSGNNNTDIELGVNGGTSAGTIEFNGNVSLGPTNAGSGAGFAGNSNSKLIIRANLTLGTIAFVNATNVPGTLEFDGTVSQTITTNDNQFICSFNNVVIGNVNNPTVNLVAGTDPSPDNILGNLTVNGSSILNLGTAQWNRNASGGTFALNGNSVLRLAGSTGGQTGSNFPLNFATLSISSTSTVEYTGTVAQTIYDIPAPGYGNLTLTNNSTKTAGGGLDVRGIMLINSTSTFAASTFSHSIGGNWTNNGTFTQATSTINFNGAAAQTVDGTGTNTFNNLTINNSSTGVTLSKDVTVNGLLTLTSGLLNTTATPGLLNMGTSATASFTTGSLTSFVNGPMTKAGTAAFTFPVGKLNAGMRIIGISAPSTSTTFTAEFLRAPSPNRASVGTGITHVSFCEHWTLDRSPGGANVTVTLSWNGSSPCNAAAYVNDLPTLRVSRYDGSQWTDAGNASTTGIVSAGTITSNTVSSFSPFALGSSSSSTNPLPVKFADVKAIVQDQKAVISWSNLTEENVEEYEVERSADGVSFSTVATVKPSVNNSSKASYRVKDENPLSGSSYYRILALETTGKKVYSTIMKVTINSPSDIFSVYPNPVTGNQFSLYIPQLTEGVYSVRIVNTAGQVILGNQFAHPGGLLSRSVELPATIPAGVYYLSFNGGTVSYNKQLLVR